MIGFAFCIFCVLFLNTSLTSTLGLDAVSSTSAFLPIMVAIVHKSMVGKMKYLSKENRQAIYIFILAGVMIIVKLLMGQDYFKSVLCLLVMPALISIYFETCSKRETNLLRKIVLLFFFIECVFAYYERYTLSYLFYTEEINPYVTSENWEFRSHSLMGHPLANAMVVAVIMAFITTSNMNFKIKLIMVVLGYISLLCFNARGATIVVTTLILPYLFFKIYKEEKSYRFLIAVILIVTISLILYLTLYTNLGGRLINNRQLIDGSAQTRLDVYSFYHFISLQDLLWGNLDNYLLVTKKLQAAGVENGLIVLILNYGILFSLPTVILLIKFHIKKLKLYNNKQRWRVVAVFYIIGLMNPNLSHPVQWIIFILAYYSFNNSSNEVSYLNNVRRTSAYDIHQMPTLKKYRYEDWNSFTS